MLRQLYEFAEQQQADLPPPMFENRRIRWIIPLRADGTFLGTLEPTCGKGDSPFLGKQFWAPYEYRSSGSKPRLLADTAEFALGVVPVGRDPQTTANRHAAFIEETIRCSAFTGNSNVKAVERFLLSWDPRKWQLPKELSATHEVTFRVGQIYPIQNQDVILYWNLVSNTEHRGATHLVCTICGQKTTGAKTRHFKIRSLSVGRASGLSLISANIPAAESYGLSSSRGVPTCSHCEESICRATNYLVANPQSHIVCGSITYIFWAKKHCEFDLKSLLVQPDPSEIHILERCSLSGDSSVCNFDSTPFHVAGLTANSARVVVRDWIGTSVGELKRNLSRSFQLQQLVGSNGDPGKPIGFLRLITGYDSASANLILRALIRLAVAGGALPILPLCRAIQRSKIEKGVTRLRAALIKMVILSNASSLEEEQMVGLDPNNNQPGYVCGRLLAVLQKIQWLALGNVNASILDRFFPSASVSPRMVFPRLLRLSQAHLRKVHEQRPAAYFALQHTLEQLTQELHEFPSVLSMLEQGLFALGYYHQRAFHRSCARGRLADNQAPDHSHRGESEEADV
ncbi:MAG TPA: type I-C CRISPR-associated protein Cas8c/Csd1 [Terriglobales bacterium]|nr:type I-C CRISPR-associated protein Cas8c/Csd1 [Terriglobales bacterium]